MFLKVADYIFIVFTNQYGNPQLNVKHDGDEGLVTLVGFASENEAIAQAKNFIKLWELE